MGTDSMRYDKLVEGALRGVMVEALRRVARKGLPGDHHFYISFRTGHPGVRIGAALKAGHAEEMTIVLQNQFWDLEVGARAFEVSLSFNGVRERLVIPFDSVTEFADPSVKFALQFRPGEGDTAADNDAAETLAGSDETRPAPAAHGAGEVIALDAFRKK